MIIKGLRYTGSTEIYHYQVNCHYCRADLEFRIEDGEHEPNEQALSVMHDEKWHKIYIGLNTIAAACPECWADKVPTAVKEKSIYEFEQKQIIRAEQHEIPFCKEITR